MINPAIVKKIKIVLNEYIVKLEKNLKKLLAKLLQLILKILIFILPINQLKSG